MGMYKYIREAWKKPKENLKEIWRNRLMEWKKQPVTIRIDKPTRVDRARSLGYKAKQGIILVRQRVPRGGHVRPQIKHARRSKRSGIRLSLQKNYQQIAEERAQKDFPNLAVLNSYWVAEDGKYKWFEIILVDPNHPVIASDPTLNWICDPKHRTRVFHGKTSAGRRSRGLMGKGKKHVRFRPSRRANMRS